MSPEIVPMDRTQTGVVHRTIRMNWDSERIQANGHEQLSMRAAEEVERLFISNVQLVNHWHAHVGCS